MWDLSLPGYKYLGPGNKLNKGKPTNYNDFVAYIHDLGYGKIIEQGGNPYLQWSDTDAEAYNQFTSEDYGGTLGKAFFGLKKMAYENGLISNFDEDRTSDMRLRGRQSNQEDYNKFAREANALENENANNQRIKREHPTEDNTATSRQRTQETWGKHGGTDPSCVSQYLRDEAIKPECIIILTDGYVPNWGSEWTAPTMWVVVGGNDAVSDNGRTIHIMD